MKTQILTLTLFLIISCLHAQDWSLLSQGDTLNFQIEKEEFIGTSVWIDSIRSDMDSTTYFLNRIVSPSGTELKRNQAQFLGQAIVQVHEQFILKATPEVHLYPMAPVGFVWMYDPLNNIFGEITTIEEELLFGQMDSVKTIVLSNAETIKISKSHGIIQFPSSTANEYYDLVGVEHLGLGNTIPKFEEIYSFNVGDVFEHDYYVGGVANGYTSSKVKKTITSKTVSNGRVSYEYTYKEIFEIKQGSSDPAFAYYAGNGEEEYVDSMEHFSNVFNHRLITNAVDLNFTDGEDNWTVSSFYLDENDVFSKQIGGVGVTWAYEVNPDLEELIPLDGVPFTFYKRYQVGLGDTYVLHYFEHSDTKELRGYIKGQDTVGTITPDYLFDPLSLSGLEDLEATIFPNPTSGQISIELTAPAGYENQLLIQNISGEILLQEKLNSKTANIDVSRFPSGMYFVSLENEKGRMMKKIIKE